MDLTPFSPDEAAEIAEDFEDLIDTEFTLDGVSYLIEAILICPFDANEREEWLAGYADGVTTMTSEEVDVYLAVSDDNGTRSYMSIRHFAAEKGIGYQFPV
jgi:hypothetical protein